MIFGIGCDLCSIDRVAEGGERFCRRYFTENEQKMFNEKRNKPQTVAANFAAKEAFSKALGTGVRKFSLNDIEVLRDELGKPYIVLNGNAEEICKTLGITEVFVSISHEGNLAMAYVIVER